MADRPLYTILEIPADATGEEIKRAFHKLALKYHPDKAGEASAEKFHQVLAAYTLLSDRDARRVYDRFGERGLSNMDAMPGMKEMGLATEIMTFYRIGFVIAAVTSVLMIVFFGLIALKLDQKADFSWHVAVIPWYIVFGVFAIATIVSAGMRVRKYCCTTALRCDKCEETEKEEKERQEDAEMDAEEGTLLSAKFRRELRFWIGNFMSLCAVATAVMLIIATAQRDHPTNSNRLSWWATFSPMLVACVSSFSSAFVFRDLLHLYGIHSVPTHGLLVLNTLSILLVIQEMVFLILLACHLEGYVNIPAHYLAIPIEIYLVCYASIILFASHLRTRGIEKLNREMPYMPDEERQRHLNASRGPRWWVEYSFAIFTLICLELGVILSTLTGSLNISFSVAFIPIFVYFGVILVLAVVLFACFTIAMDEVVAADEAGPSGM